jgi:hypothetical protein
MREPDVVPLVLVPEVPAVPEVPDVLPLVPEVVPELVPEALPSLALVSMYFVSAILPAAVDGSVGSTQPMIVMSAPGWAAGLVV